MSPNRLEDLQVRAEGLVEGLADLPAGHEIVASPLLQRLEANLTEQSRLLAAGDLAHADALDVLQRRELDRLVSAAAGARGDLARWRAALMELHAALDGALLADGRWGHDG